MMRTHEVWLRMGDDKTEKVVVGEFDLIVDGRGRPAYLKGIEYDAGTMTRVTPANCQTVIPMDNVLRFHSYEGADYGVGSRAGIINSHAFYPNSYFRAGTCGACGRPRHEHQKPTQAMTSEERLRGPFFGEGDSEVLALIDWLKRRTPFRYENDPRWSRNLNRLEALCREGKHGS